MFNKVKNLISETKSYFSQKIEGLKKGNTRSAKDLNKIEEKLKKIENEEKKVEDNLVRNSKIMVKFWLFGLLIVFLGYLLFKSLDIIYLILTAFIVSIAMEAIIDFFQRKLKRGLAIAITYFLLLIFIIGGFFVVIPFILKQSIIFIEFGINKIRGLQILLEDKTLIQIINDLQWLPTYIKSPVIDSLSDPELLTNIQNKLQNNISQIIGVWSEYAKNIFNISVNFIGGFVSFLTKAGITLTLSVLFSIEKSSVIKFIGKLGGKKSNYIQIKLERIYKKLGLWLKGQLLLCLFIGLTILISLIILSLFGLHIPQKGTLAIIAGFTELIPYLGPILGGLAAILIVMIHNGFYAGIIMLGIVVVIQRLENNVLIPVVMNKTLGVNPITIFISMIIGGLIMGFVGILLSVPIAVIITMFFDDSYK